MLALAAACNPASPPASRVPSSPGGTGGVDEGAGGSKPGGNGGTGGTAGTGTPVATGGNGAGGGPAAGAGGSTPSPADAASTGGDPPGDASASADAASGTPAGCTAKLCDDFESYAAGGPPGGAWKAALDKGMLAVDEKKAFSGARSVRFTHQGAPAVMFIELRQPVLPLPGHVMHGRLMYYLTQGPTGQYTHWEIVRGGGPLEGGKRAQFNTGGENGKFAVNYEPGDCTKYSKVPFPMKRWACYQWEFNGPKNEIRLWIDGQPVDDVPVAPAGQCWKAPMVFDTVHIGWESYHGNQPVELWIDDVAVGDQPIPCPTGMPSKP